MIRSTPRSLVAVFVLGAVHGFGSSATAQLNFDPTLILGPPATLPAAPAPVVERLPVRTPYPRLPMRGQVPPSKDGQISASLIVHGVPKPIVIRTAVGRFCGEVVFDKPGTYELELRSQDIHGTVSEATRGVVTYDPKAPRLPWLRSCAGTEALGQCVPSAEHCGNGQDDDCDGLVDRLDPECDRKCTDDALELRDGSAAYLSHGTTKRLRLCDGPPAADVDLFGVHVRPGHGLLLGVKAVGVARNDPVALRLAAGGRAVVVVNGDPSNKLVSLAFFPSQIDTVTEPRNLEFEVSEVTGRAVEYQVYTEVIRIDPSKDIAAQEARERDSTAAPPAMDR